MTREQLEHVLRAALALREHMIESQTLEQRILQLDAAQHPVERIRAWAHRRAVEATAS